MKTLLAFVLFALPTLAAHYNCTTSTSGNLSTVPWANCNGTWPHNHGGDTYSAHATGVNVVIDVDVTLGKSVSAYEAAFSNGDDKLSCTGCSYANGDRIRLVARNTFDNLTVGTNWPLGLGVSDYYIVNWVSASDFQVSATSGGSPVLFTSNGATGIKIQEYTPAISQSGNATWTIATGVTFRQQGDGRIGTPSGSTRDVFVYQAGSNHIIDSSLAANPDKTSYCIHTPTVSYGVGAIVRVNGTLSQPVNWSSDLTNGALPAGKCLHAANSTYAGDLIGTFLNVQNMGGTVFNVFWTLTPIASFSLTDSTCDACGPIVDLGGAANSATSTHLLRRVRFRNTPSSHGYVNYSANFANAVTTGTRLIEDSVFDGMLGKVISPGLPSLRDVTIRNVVFGRSPRTGCTAPWAQVNNVFILSEQDAGGGGWILCGDASNIYALSTAGGNFRIFSAATNAAGPYTYDGLTVQVAREASISDGDIFISAGQPSFTRRITNMVSVVGKSAGKYINPGLIVGTGGSNVNVWEIENATEAGGAGSNTKGYQGTGNYSVALSEANPGYAGRLSAYKGILHWDIDRTSGGEVNSRHLQCGGVPAGGTVTAVNAATPSGLDYNACVILGVGACAGSIKWGTHDADGVPPWDNGSTGTALTNYGTPYDCPMTGATPGANDMNGVDPRFADIKRDAEAWAATFHGASADIAGIRSVFDTIPLDTVGARVKHLQWWVRRGYAPRDIRYAVKAAPRGRIGGVDVMPVAAALIGQ